MMKARFASGLAALVLASMAGLVMPIPAAARPPVLARPSGIAVPGGHVRVTQRGAGTVISGIVAGRRVALVLPAEEGIFPGSLGTVQSVGGLPGRVLILSIDYYSRPNGTIYQCGAGIETVVRVIALEPRPHETFHQLVGSCWSDIDPGDVSWDAAASRLVIERDLMTGSTGHTRTSYRIDAAGNVTPDKMEHLP